MGARGGALRRFLKGRGGRRVAISFIKCCGGTHDEKCGGANLTIALENQIPSSDVIRSSARLPRASRSESFTSGWAAGTPRCPARPSRRPRRTPRATPPSGDRSRRTTPRASSPTAARPPSRPSRPARETRTRTPPPRRRGARGRPRRRGRRWEDRGSGRPSGARAAAGRSARRRRSPGHSPGRRRRSRVGARLRPPLPPPPPPPAAPPPPRATTPRAPRVARREGGEEGGGVRRVAGGHRRGRLGDRRPLGRPAGTVRGRRAGLRRRGRLERDLLGDGGPQSAALGELLALLGEGVGVRRHGRVGGVAATSAVRGRAHARRGTRVAPSVLTKKSLGRAEVYHLRYETREGQLCSSWLLWFPRLPAPRSGHTRPRRAA